MQEKKFVDLLAAVKKILASKNLHLTTFNIKLEHIMNQELAKKHPWPCCQAILGRIFYYAQSNADESSQQALMNNFLTKISEEEQAFEEDVTFKKAAYDCIEGMQVDFREQIVMQEERFDKILYYGNPTTVQDHRNCQVIGQHIKLPQVFSRIHLFEVLVIEANVFDRVGNCLSGPSAAALATLFNCCCKPVAILCKKHTLTVGILQGRSNAMTLNMGEQGIGQMQGYCSFVKREWVDFYWTSSGWMKGGELQMFARKLLQ